MVRSKSTAPYALFQPFDEGPVMVMVEQAKSFNNAQIYYGSLLWLSVGLLFGSDKGFGGGTTGWKFGSYKSSQKWANQMTKRGWTVEQINEAVLNGARYKAVNNINPDHPATRYVHPVTGRSVIIDDVTQEVLHIGGDGFVY